MGFSDAAKAVFEACKAPLRCQHDSYFKPFENSAGSNRNDAILDAISFDGTRIRVLGCGSRDLNGYLPSASQDCQCKSIDFLKKSLGQVRNDFAPEITEFLRRELLSLFFESAKFDVTLSPMIFAIICDPILATDEGGRFLKPGGTLRVTLGKYPFPIIPDEEKIRTLHVHFGQLKACCGENVFVHLTWPMEVISAMKHHL